MPGIFYITAQRKTRIFNKFLEGKKLDPPADFEVQRVALKDLAYAGKMRRHDYFEKLTRLYGISDS